MSEKADPALDETLASGERAGDAYAATLTPAPPPAGADETPLSQQATIIGRYRVLRRLGAGGMGVVYAAYDPELDRTVAVKVVRELQSHRATLQQRLRREAQALARLTHANVVSVYDVGVADGHVHVVMQYVDGESLDQWLARRPPAREVIARFVAAGRGLAAAHAAGLVHRDFKPSNVLVDPEGTVRVTDFGLARISDLADRPADRAGA